MSASSEPDGPSISLICYQIRLGVFSITPRTAQAVYKGQVIQLGYPTQNLTIPASTNRTLRLANLYDAPKVREIALANFRGLVEILRWNAERGV